MPDWLAYVMLGLILSPYAWIVYLRFRERREGPWYRRGQSAIPTSYDASDWGGGTGGMG